MDASGASVSFSAIFDFIIRYGLPLLWSSYLLWAILIKDPPGFVPWRYYKEAIEENRELKRNIRDLSHQAEHAIQVTDKAVQLAKPKPRHHVPDGNGDD